MKRDRRIATSVDADTKRLFRVEAAKRDMDMSELMRQLIDEFLEEQPGNARVPAMVTAN